MRSIANVGKGKCGINTKSVNKNQDESENYELRITRVLAKGRRWESIKSVASRS